MMSPSKQKRKGDTAEREICEYLNENLISGNARKNPGSGSIGTTVHEPILTGDLNIEIYGFPKKLKAECKSGYSHKTDAAAKSLALEKRWLDKIREEAEANYRMPIFFGKFDSVRSGTKFFVALDIVEFVALANHVTKLQKELDKLYDQK